MRVLYIDIDSLRPDHLGCYGYHRNTSPNIDRVAESGVRFDNYYVTDAPCLPSRSALWSGRFGFHTGVVGHGGSAGQPFPEGSPRGFKDLFGPTSWMARLRYAGMKTATVSPFADRHSAWHWLAGFSEVYDNFKKCGNELAHEGGSDAIKWIKRNAKDENWFLHVNMWDPHTPYRTPMEFGDPFAEEPLAAWLTEEVRDRCYNGYGPHSAQDPSGYGEFTRQDQFPRIPAKLDSMENMRKWINGYDTGIRYADEWVGRILNALADEGILEDTVIMISADHGENQGELNVWGDHQTADHITNRVPMIVKWPGVVKEKRVDKALHYHFDWAATTIELLGGEVPDIWDGRPFTEAFRNGEDAGRDFLVLSQNAWACCRSVRWGDHLFTRTYHDGFKQLEPKMLFNLAEDPHEQYNLVDQKPDLVTEGMANLCEWHDEMLLTSQFDRDPMATVLREGGPFHTRGRLPMYMERLRATGRGHHADHLAAIHPDEV